jgi:3',5'-cyclic AMP phosphodiesterase CpdA
VGGNSLTRSTIAKIESGARRTVTAEEVAVLAQVLGVTATDLLETSGRTLLHLSELQCGGDHLLSGNGPTIGADIRYLEDRLGVKPEVVVVSGDLTKTGTKREFDQALTVLEQLSDTLKIERGRMIIVPGDQDISRIASEAYFRGCEADEQEPRSPFWPKWEPFASMFSRFYADDKAVSFEVGQPWTLLQLPELQLVIAGLNSTMANSHRDEDNYGWVGVDQLRWFAERLRTFEERGWLRIGVVHHNVARGAMAKHEYLRDTDDLERILAPHLDLLLHGHTHDAKLYRLNTGLPVLTTGGAAVTADAYPDEIPNRYQLVRVEANRVERWARVFQPDQGHWGPDTGVSRDGHSWDGGREERRMPMADTASFTDVQVSKRARKSGQEVSRLFLSYAEEDEETALEIATRFDQEGFEVYPAIEDDSTAIFVAAGRGLSSVRHHWQDPRQQQGGWFLQRIEEEINQADAFLALVSPHSLTSPWCRLEQELAMHHELDLQTRDSSKVFIRVLKIAETRYPQTGFLRSYEWFDLTSPEKDQALQVLSGELRTSRDAAPRRLRATNSDRGLSLFRDRTEELDKVHRGLTNPSGPHFWLVISPPQLGKSLFLNRLSVALAASEAVAESSAWVTRLVDLREQPLDLRSDAGLLLASLFGLQPPMTITERTLRDIAQGIIRGKKAYLCLLDSAELLENETARTLRWCLSQIYELVQSGGNIGVRLGLVVASRRDDEWRGVSPTPRISTLALTEFKVHVVRQALDDVARSMNRSFPAFELERNAALVYRFSEGLPALLVRCLQWIQAEQWLALYRLESQELFDELARPYIKEHLLSLESLLPEREQLDRRRGALEQAFRVLAPYRLFTQSHLRYHVEGNPALGKTLEDLGWPIEDLWKAISETALLVPLLDEPWQEIHWAIRRLLFRYYYRSDRERAAAHREACRFVGVWAEQQSGKEQVVGLVECLWHEAALLRLSRPESMKKELSTSVRKLSQTLTSSSLYTMPELRTYAADRMRNDEELQEELGQVPWLIDELVDIVVSPEQVFTNE